MAPTEQPSTATGAQSLSGFRIQTRVTDSAFFTPPHVSIFRGENVSSQPMFKENANKYRATSLLSYYLSLTTDNL